MKIFILVVAIICIGYSATAQTRRIAHRSHSGAGHSFNAATPDHFGEIMEIRSWPEVKNAELKPRASDTVKVIKVKPWKPAQDSLPPKVNPVYTKAKPQQRKPAARSK